jgi:hypothetical protein
MVEVTDTARQVRKFILNSFVNTGHAPNVGDIMEALGVTRAAVLEAFREIDAIDTFWLEKGTENIRLLAPFANTSTPYKVTVDGVHKWYAVCGLDALGIWTFFPGKTVQVRIPVIPASQAMCPGQHIHDIIVETSSRRVLSFHIPRLA